MATPKIMFLMSTYGHDPTETAVPYIAFKNAGFQISFATSDGSQAVCDAKMLTGITQKLLGADKVAINAYNKMLEDEPFKKPLKWTDESFDLGSYNLIFLPGGHEKGVKEVIESAKVKELLKNYFTLPEARRGGHRGVAAICHGVLVLSENLDNQGKSLIHDCKTTTLPGLFETGVFWGTRAFLGDYYKAFGPQSENCEDMVKKRLDDPKLFIGSNNPSPFIVEDDKYNYVSGRYPADAQLLADKAIEMVRAGAKA